MLNQQSPQNCTSADFEKAAINRLRSLATYIPESCLVFREPWGCSTVLCLDFKHSPEFLEATREKTDLLGIAVQDLGLASSVIFRIGNKVISWTPTIGMREKGEGGKGTEG